MCCRNTLKRAGHSVLQKHVVRAVLQNSWCTLSGITTSGTTQRSLSSLGLNNPPKMGLTTSQNGSPHLHNMGLNTLSLQRADSSTFHFEIMHALVGDVGIRLEDPSTSIAITNYTRIKLCHKQLGICGYLPSILLLRSLWSI